MDLSLGLGLSLGLSLSFRGRFELGWNTVGG